MSKHTPGPWFVAGPTIRTEPTDVHPTGFALAHVLNPFDGAAGAADVVAANARLIATSPELLDLAYEMEAFAEAAMNDAIEAGDEMDLAVWAARRDRCLALIAKATGATS